MNDESGAVKIEVSKGHEKCLKILKDAIAALPPGDIKQQAATALEYLSKSFAGEQLPVEDNCRPGSWLIP